MAETPSPQRQAVSHPCGSIAPLFWQAMRGAASVPYPGAVEGISDEEMAERLPLLWEAVWQAAGGHEPKLAPRPPAQHARHLLDNVRRSFIELLRSVEGDLPVQEVVRVLDAIERVQSAVDRDSVQTLREQVTGPSGMELLMEVAHDLRSPLASILFLTETLRAGRGTPLKPGHERQLDLIHSAAFEIDCLADDLTALVNGGEHLLEGEPALFAVRNVFSSVRDIVQPIADEKGLEIRFAGPGAEYRMGHPAALGRALLNLVTIAVRYTDEGFVEIAAQDLSPTRVEFSVRDSGPGVPDDVIASLVQPFDPLKVAREGSFSGTDLGLVICRRLVTAMGGGLQVRQGPERGSCFYFGLELPAKAGEILPAEAGGSAGFEAGAPLEESAANHG